MTNPTGLTPEEVGSPITQKIFPSHKVKKNQQGNTQGHVVMGLDGYLGKKLTRKKMWPTAIELGQK